MIDPDKIIARRDRLRSTRGVWESHWQEIADRVLPRQASFVTRREPGEKRTREIFDATAALALERFSAALESMLTPRTQRWHRLRASDPDLNDLPEVRAWFDRAEDILFGARYSPHANYAAQQHEVYMSLGAFGTGVLFVGQDDARNGLLYRATHLADCYVAENFQGRIDTLYRDFDYTDNDPFPAETHESGLDRATMIAQDSIADTDRALKFAKTDAGTLVPTLPSSVERANRFLAFDADGNPIAASGPSGDSSIPVSAYAETLLDDMDVATARATLGLVIGVDVAPVGPEQVVIPIGAVTQWLGATAPSNWLMLNGDTIGSDVSAATQRDDSYETLFALIWNSIADAQAPVPGGRGGNAAADWAAGKSITLPDIRGRAIIGTGAGAGLTTRTHAGSGGFETHQLTIAEMPIHNFGITIDLGAAGQSGTVGSGDGFADGLGTANGLTDSKGGDVPHTNMQPWLALNIIVRAS